MPWSYVSQAVAIGIALVVVGMALAVLRALYDGTINLTYLLAEPAAPDTLPSTDPAAPPVAPPPPQTPKASLSRFQFLVFTFVIAGVYLVLSLEAGTFVEIPEHVLWLLGVSGGTYATSKGIKAWSDNNNTPPKDADK